MEGDPPKKRFIESSSFYKNCEQENPFSAMKIHDSSFLDDVPSRSLCPKCNKSRKYYCYACYVPVEEVSKRIPFVKLPVKIDIIKHPREVDGKSTSAHAAVLAPEDVKIYTFPDFPSYENEQVLLIFPGKSAIPFEDWWKINVSSSSPKTSSDTILNNSEILKSLMDLQCKSSDCDKNCDAKNSYGTKTVPFSKIVFIDSTWRQSKALYNDERLRKLPCVLLNSYKSLFWRYYRGKQETHLSTIEAVYYFLLELHGLSRPGVPYNGEYDNILFFFQFMYFKIRTLYDPLKLKAYQPTTT